MEMSQAISRLHYQYHLSCFEGGPWGEPEAAQVEHYYTPGDGSRGPGSSPASVQGGDQPLKLHENGQPAGQDLVNASSSSS